METQKIINLLNDSSNEESKFATKKWYVIDSQTTKGKYKQGETIKFEAGTIKSSLCNYSDTFISVTGNITVNADNKTDVAFKICAPFSTCTIIMMYLSMKQIIFTLHASFQGVKRLFVLAYFIADSRSDEAGIKSIFSQKEKLNITMY